MHGTGRGRRDLKIAILGAGPGGLCMAMRLKQEGFDNFVILEKSEGVGGTWNRNRYPGCACDIQSHLYSFSFEFKPDWSRPYAPQPEILEYLEGCAKKHGLYGSIRFDETVTGARWDDEDATWTVETGSGDDVVADVVVSAIGMFNDLVYPDIPGLDSFAGTRWHSAQWNWDHDLTTATVGVIGSAASAIQFVPEIAKEAKQIHYFQRTANWVLPKEDDPYDEAELEEFRTNPTKAWDRRNEIFDLVDNGTAFTDAGIRASRERIVLDLIEREVHDPELRKKLVPTHPWGCKRPLFSNDYYPTFNRPNLELVTDPIERITPDSIVTADGVERTIDTLVTATGFNASQYLSAIDVRGRNGLSIEEAWNDGAQAYMGVTTSGFPNLFMLYGPNTNNGSIITMIEYQVEHAVKHVQRLATEGLAWVDVKPTSMADYNVRVQKDIDGIEPWQADCSGYYRAPSGRIVTQWPHSMTRFKDQTAVIDPDDYESAPV